MGPIPGEVDMTIPTGASTGIGVVYFTDGMGNLIPVTEHEFLGGVLVDIDLPTP